MSRFSHYLRFLLASFGKAPWDTGISPPELLDFIRTHSPGRALDLGCGTGTNAITLAQHGWQVTGVDFIPRSIHQARRKAKQAGVQTRFIIDSVARLHGLDGSFDLILDIGCYHGLSLSERPAYRGNIRRLLEHGGTFLLYGFLHDPLTGMKTGFSSDDFVQFSHFLSLQSRVENPDRRGRASVWVEYSSV